MSGSAAAKARGKKLGRPSKAKQKVPDVVKLRKQGWGDDTNSERVIIRRRNCSADLPRNEDIGGASMDLPVHPMIIITIVVVIVLFITKQMGNASSENEAEDKTHTGIDPVQQLIASVPPDQMEAIRNQFLAEQQQVSGQLDMFSDLMPITQQLGDGIGDKEVPDGGIIDSFIRGYYLGYVNEYLKKLYGREIDAIPHKATEAFAILNGSLYDGDYERGVHALNESLKERNDNHNKGSDSAYSLGFKAGSLDYGTFKDGMSPCRLKDYVELKLA